MVKTIRGRGRGKSDLSTDSGAHAQGSPLKKESIQEKTPRKKLNKEQERKLKLKENPNLDTPAATPVNTPAATPSKANSAKGKKKAGIDSDNSTSDNKTVDKTAKHTATNMVLRSKEREVSSGESLVGQDSAELENLKSKSEYPTDVAFMASTPPDTPVTPLPFEDKVKISPSDPDYKIKSELDETLMSRRSEVDQQHQDLKASEIHQGFPSGNEDEANEAKPKVDVSMPMPQYSEDSNKQEPNLDLKDSQVHHEFSSDNESKKAESKTDGSESSVIMPCSKDIDWIKLDLDLKTMKPEVTEYKSTIDESPSPLQDPNLMTLKEGMQNLDLNASNTKRDVSSEKQNELGKSESEEIINLPIDLNLSFEFDSHGNRKVLVDNNEYILGKNRKQIFNIGHGSVQLSFIDNKVSILAEKGAIDCSMRKNHVAFFLKASTIRRESSSEGPTTNEPSHSQDSQAVEDLGGTNVTGITKQDSLLPIEEMPDKLESRNFEMLTLEENSSFIPSSVAQKSLQDRTNRFLSEYHALCKTYETDFIEWFNGKN